MSTTLISMSIALILALGLVITLGVLSLLSGGLNFFISTPKLTFLKSSKGEQGFAFGLDWNAAQEPARFDHVKIRVFNPFGSPTQVEVGAPFSAKSDTFAEDVDMGPGMSQVLGIRGVENATIQVELISTKDGVTHHFDMKAFKFFKKLDEANQSADEYLNKNTVKNESPVFHSVSRSFIAEPLAEGNKALKIASNPEFAGDFQKDGGGGEAKENYAVSKVWIEPGCIVCNACEAIYPEVFHVTDSTCIVNDGYPKDNGLLVEEAAEACPVEVIKFEKA